MKKQFRSFEDACIFAQKLNLRSQLDWNEYRKSQKSGYTYRSCQNLQK